MTNQTPSSERNLTDVISEIPYRMAFAGGWIDQPFVSRLNPSPPGSMVVVALEPEFFFMERCGMATGTRNVAIKLWNGVLPERPPFELMRDLYCAENKVKKDPSGSQDMAGLIYPGINRLDYCYNVEGGVFPSHVESNNDPEVARWLENVIHVLPVTQRMHGYNPLGIKNLDSEWIRRLGQSGKDCYDAIVTKDMDVLGKSFNESMKCWEAILPHTVQHPTITIDLMGILKYYQSNYSGAMYSGCGGGYLFVVSEKSIPGSFKIKVRVKP